MSDEQKLYEYLVSLPKGHLIDDHAARVIANMWHGGQASAVYAFVSTGTIDRDGMLAELDRELGDVPWHQITPEERENMLALRKYVERHGDRDQVAGWSDIWL